jgi:2-hydroxy-6-oxonona-2,4-dienedioate hydrolase
MPTVEINGGQVVYEVLGETDSVPLALTPGGRFSKDFPGVRPLAERLTQGGVKVLLWDRPNTGASDVQISDRWLTESHMYADTLQQLIKNVGFGPTVIAGGSGGARASIITAIEYPEVTSKLFVWHIVGGVYGSFVLGCHYVMGNITTAKRGGMEAVVDMPEWQERIAQNPRNRERLLSIPKEEFIRIMKLWLNAYVSKPGQAIPGVADEDFARIKVPTTIIRSGENDDDHPKRTSFEVHALIKGSRLVEPPWAEDAWEQAGILSFKTGEPHAFDPWPLAAPLIVDFCGEKLTA